MLARFLASLAAGEVSDVARRMRISAIVYAVAGFLGAVGALFLIGAGFILAAQRWGAVSAALGFGAGFVAIALLVILALKLWSRARARRASRRRVADAGMIAGTAALALLPSLIARGSGLKTLAIPLLAAAGYAIYRENSKPDGTPSEGGQ